MAKNFKVPKMYWLARRRELDRIRRLKEKETAACEKEAGRKQRRKWRGMLMLPRGDELWPQLVKLVHLRAGKTDLAITNMVRAVVEIWSRFEGDPHLYIRRVSDPEQAHAVVRVDRDLGRDPVQLYKDGDLDVKLRCYHSLLIDFLDAGVTPEALKETVDEIVASQELARRVDEREAEYKQRRKGYDKKYREKENAGQAGKMRQESKSQRKSKKSIRGVQRSAEEGA